MKYSIRISPVQSENSEILERMGRILGIQDRLNLDALVRNGGVVKDNLSKPEADRLARGLRSLGIVVEVFVNRYAGATNGYQVTLVDAGSSHVSVIKGVREITGLNLKDSKELVDNLGVIGIYKTKEEADGVKKVLTSAGAKVIIERLDGVSPDPVPEPDPQPDPEPEPEYPPNNEFLVSGRVRLPNRYPVEACTVRAFDRDLRSEQFLGESLTDESGSYHITYTKEQFKRAEKGTADLVVRAFNPVGKPLSESAIHFNAPPEARIDLELSEMTPVEPSEYERLVSLLTPLLEGISLSGLTSDDVWFLANETDRSLAEIAFVADDARLAQRAGMPEAVFFGLAMQEVGIVEPEGVGKTQSDQRSLPLIDLPTVLEQPLESLLEILKSAIEKRLIPIELNHQLHIIEKRFSELMSSGATESVGSRRRRLQRLGQIAGLPDEAVAAVAHRLDAGLIRPELWEELVHEGVVAEDKISELKFTVELGALTEDNLHLTETLKSRPLTALGRAVTSLQDLAVLESSDWEELVAESKVTPPGGKSTSDYAASLAQKVEKQFPTEVFRSRVLGRKENPVGTQLQKVHSLLEINVGLFSKSVRSREPLALNAAIDFGDRDAGEIESLRSNLQELDKLSRTFRHLGVAEILDRTDLPAKDKAQTVGVRLAAVDTFFSNNIDLELKSIDFFGVASNDGPTKVSYAGIDDELQPLVRQQMLAHQRVMTVAPDAAATVALLQCGYDSAMSIAAESSAAIARKAGIGLAQARDIRTAALDRRLRSLVLEGTLFEINPSTASSMRVVPVSDNAGSALKKIDGYADQFGSQNYCSCRHCASVLGPAAYFVDLMRFVEKHVLSETFGSSEEHKLHLRQRRPDLWTLPLTCHNTNTLIPYLDIINSVLEQYIHTDGVNAYELLSSSTRSFNQPFHLPLEELRIYLQHFSLDLSAIAEGVRGWGPDAARESLRLSPEEWGLLTQPDASDESVYGFYGRLGSLSKVDVQRFLKATGVTRSELDRLVSLVSVIGTATPPRVAADRDGDLQPTGEVLLNLSVASLSRIHRFVRLWRQLPWKMEALDYVLRHRAPALLDPEATPADRSAALAQVATLRHMQQQLHDVSLDVLLSLVGPIPLESLQEDDAPLFDRLFNAARRAPDEVAKWSAGESPNSPLSPAVNFRHSALAATNESDNAQQAEVDEAQYRLLGALGVSDADLEILLKHLLRSAVDDGTVELTHENLTLLHRHAKLATRLGLSVASLFTALRAIKKTEESEGARVETLADLRALLSFLEWQGESGLSIPDIHFIVRGPHATENGYNFDQARLHELTQVARESLGFSANAFSAISEIQPEDIDILLALLVRDGMIEELPAGDSDDQEIAPRYRVTETYDPDAPLTFTSGDPEHEEALDRLGLQEQAILQVLNRHKVDRKSVQISLLSSLADTLGINQEFLRPLFAIAGEDIEGLDRLIALEEHQEQLLSVCQRVEEAVRWLETWKFDAETLQFIIAHQEIFGLKFGERMKLNSIRLLSTYAQLRKLFDGKREKLNQLLSDQEIEVNLLAELVDESSSQVRSFVDNIDPAMTSDPTVDPKPVHGIDRLMQLLHAIDLGRRVGLDGRAVKLLISDEHGQLAKARDLVRGAFRAKYDDEAAFEEAVEPFRDRLRGRRRDALVDYILTQPLPAETANDDHGFETSSDLYHYFLLDTELEGCARTSLIVAATNSLQLYVHRCLMGLEQSKSGAENPVHVQPTDEMLAEWPWRKNYRVWEANRKVFLHTENFLEPDLRDNKSPLFQKLEGELLQQDINADTVEAAYLQYLKGFTEIANLKIVGSCYDEETRTTHVFGKSVVESGRLFHRKMVKLNYELEVGWVSQSTYDVEWTPWEELDLKADMDYLSPIVVEGQLHLLWVERRPRTVTKIRGGSADTEEWSDYVLKVSRRTLTGQWSQAIEINLPDSIQTAQDFRFDLKVYPFLLNKQLYIARRDPNSYLSRPRDIQIGGLWSGDVSRDVLKVDLFEKAVGYFSGIDRQGEGVGNRPYILSRIQHPEGKIRLTLPNFIHRQSDFGADAFGWLEAYPMEDANEQLEFLTESPIHYIQAVLNSSGSYFAGIHNQSFLLDFDPFSVFLLLPAPRWKALRLTTPVAETLTQRFYRQGLNAFLSSATQKTAEPDFPVDIVRPSVLKAPKSPDDHLDFAGPFGLYYRELFLHIPLLLANHLNANQRFEEAQRWYHYVFNPVTSEKAPSDEEIAGGVSSADHYWNYLEFKGREQDSLHEILRDGAALEQYRRNPFNPHAVARMRLNAYRKSVVMKYLDNLIDWGDHLFAQDTRESINEATLLYVMAADILGDRPVEFGSCEEVGIRVRLVSAGENKISVIKVVREITGFGLKEAKDIVDELGVVAEQLTAAAAKDIKESLEAAGATVMGEQPATSVTYDDLNTQDEYLPTVENVTASLATTTLSEINSDGLEASTILPGVQQMFCVPNNQDLLAYWDRVGDRLFKIRNCMNLSGVRRELALFAPPIDPALLVRAKAAGLSLEDALALGDSQVPPYRFTYLSEKAKSYAATVQGFGSALLSALEKKDAEELMLLRATHQQNLLALTKQVKEQQIEAAQESLAAIKVSRESAAVRKDYYETLADEGLTLYEKSNLGFMTAGSAFEMLASTYSTAASIGYAVPQAGSPLAMTYGGQQLGAILTAIGGGFNNLASISRYGATMSSTLGGYERREQEWSHQKELAEKEIAQLDQQLLGAEIQVDIAERELEIHQQTVEQEEEVFDFYRDKLSSFGLYTWLSTELNKLHRIAYNMAHEVAQMAQAAYRYERDMDNMIFIQSGHWDSHKAGLLAGDRLMLQLQQMEKAYLETNRRDYEVDQTFSLAQIDPLALQELRQKASCDFRIAEAFFDVVYPGQYRRRIKSVRLTIPCVTGPYTNINAKLTLVDAHIRETPDQNGSLVPEPRSRNVSIATSRAQNDGGVFELNFRDERYLPFEGAGAVSNWKLDLPAQFRSFDYETIADVLVHISYTAKEDGAYRSHVESQLGDALNELAEDSGIPRAFSVSQEFGSEFHRFTQSVDTTDSAKLSLHVDQRHYPYFLRGKDLVVHEAMIALKLREPFTRPDDGGAAELPVTLRVSEGDAEDADAEQSTISGGIPGLDQHPHWRINLDSGNGNEVTLGRKGVNVTAELESADFLEIVQNWRQLDDTPPNDSPLALDSLRDVLEDIFLVLTVKLKQEE